MCAEEKKLSGALSQDSGLGGTHIPWLVLLTWGMGNGAAWPSLVADLALLGTNHTPSSLFASLARWRSGEASSPSCLKEIPLDKGGS